MAAESTLAWFRAALSERKSRIMRLMQRIGDAGFVRALNPAIFLKLTNMLNDVAAEKDQEMRILGEIEAIEQKHRFRRVNGGLRHADDAEPETAAAKYDCAADVEERPKRGLAWLFALLFLISSGRRNDKNQDLTQG